MRWLVVVLAGCGFTHGSNDNFDARGADTVTDTGKGDTAATSCLPSWYASTIRFADPVPIAELNSASYDRDPFLTPDELTIYISSSRAGSAEADIWSATRADLTSPFSILRQADSFNSSSTESKVSLTANGLTVVVGSSRGGGSGGIDVWEATRESTSAQWPTLSRTRVMMVETSGNDHDPTISPDGLRLYVAPDNPAPQHLVMASRAATSGNFGTPATMTELSSQFGEGDPSPHVDQRVIVFASNRTLLGAGNGDIWYASRASDSGTFGVAMAVPGAINTEAFEGDPHLSSDGCRLYFARYMGAGTNWDIFVASAL